MGGIKRHWSFFLGAISNLPSLWHGLVWFFDWGSRFDLVATKLREHGGMSAVLGFFLSPPPWLVLVTLPVGLALIYWDFKGRPRFWLSRKIAPQINRITCVEFLNEAAKRGWDFSSPDSLHLLDFQDAMRQGGADGTLTIWGKLKRWTSDELMRKELLEKIPPDHWKEFFVHLFAARNNENFDTYSWSPSPPENFGRRGYVDLHVEKGPAIEWLNRDTADFKGKTKPR